MALREQTSRQILDNKLMRGLLIARRQRLFLLAMIQPTVSCCALGLTYSVLRSPEANDAIWLSGLLALYALQVIAIWRHTELLVEPSAS